MRFGRAGLWHSCTVAQVPCGVVYHKCADRSTRPHRNERFTATHLDRVQAQPERSDPLGHRDRPFRCLGYRLVGRLRRGDISRHDHLPGHRQCHRQCHRQHRPLVPRGQYHHLDGLFSDADLSEQFSPLSILPAWLQPVACALPLAPLNTLLRDIVYGVPVEDLWRLGVLGGWIVVATILTVRFFRWE
jgi:hypothetical protein